MLGVSKGKYAPHILVALFFVSLLGIGLCIYRDYGISWDESTNRKNGAISAVYANGKLNYPFISKENVAELAETERARIYRYTRGTDVPTQSSIQFDEETLLQYRDKDYGVFFELFLIGMEWVLKLNEPREVYFMRHLLTFLMFYVGVIFFYLLLQNRFKNWKISLLGCLFLVASPRIFAHSFYNSKDLVFMSVYIITCHSLTMFLRAKNLRTAIWHAFTTAILIDIRIVGVVVPAATSLFYGIDALQRKNFQHWFKKNLPILIVHFLFLGGFIILFWPYLWGDPVNNFIQTFANMSKFRWNVFVLYMGKYFKASELPKHYLLVWILITTPLLYTLGFLMGLTAILGKTLQHGRTLFTRIRENDEDKQDYVLLLLCLLPLVTVIAIRARVYDGWRHLFFIYPPFLYVSIRGLIFSVNLVKNSLKFAGHKLDRKSIV